MAKSTKDDRRTNSELLQEVEVLRRRLAKVEQAKVDLEKKEESLRQRAERLGSLLETLPVMINACGDISMAVRATKAGATDFIEKPLDRQSFLSAVQSALNQIAPVDRVAGKALTKTEMRVLSLILNGNGNKQTARILHRSVRTIEDHRCHIMRKLGVDNLVDLVKRAAVMGLLELPEH